jgi:phosphomannomutase
MGSHVLFDIVKTYDVRGLVESEVTPLITRALGAAFVDVISLPGSEIVVGYDMRESSPLLADAFMEGVLSQGGSVRNIGLSSTDMVYFASGSWDLPAVMFTASHNPATYNGLKFSRAKAQGISLNTGLSDIRDRAIEYLEGTRVFDDVGGSIQESDVLADYARYVRQLVPLTGERPLRIVVDAANGMAGHTVPAVLGDALGLAAAGIDIVPLYFELDGTFPNHEANPLDPRNLVDLKAAVLAEGADLGLAFDGDADRCFVIDETGHSVTPSTVAALVSKREIARVKESGEKGPIHVLHNLLCSRGVAEVIEEMGAIPLRTRVGHSLIKDQMRQSGAVFGGEHSAHYYFRDFWGADNGMLAALHVIAELRAASRPLSELTQHFSRYAESGEINSSVESQEVVMSRLLEHFSDRGVLDELDGATIMGETEGAWWWFNVRGSNTEPLLRLNVEGQTTESMERMRDEVLALIRQG